MKALSLIILNCLLISSSFAIEEEPKSEGKIVKKVEKILCSRLKPIFFKRAPIAIKLAPNANAGLSIPFIDLNPLKKYLEFITIHQEIIFQHQDYLINHFLFRQ
mgnify:CR=1 FL=1